MAEFLEPTTDDDGRLVGWVADNGISAAEAIRQVAHELDLDPDTLEARAVLMRWQSEVEARIEPLNEDEVPVMVECTKRARDPKPFWRIEVATPQQKGAGR